MKDWFKGKSQELHHTDDLNKLKKKDQYNYDKAKKNG